jgi:hypothetical protein
MSEQEYKRLMADYKGTVIMYYEHYTEDRAAHMQRCRAALDAYVEGLLAALRAAEAEPLHPDLFRCYCGAVLKRTNALGGIYEVDGERHRCRLNDAARKEAGNE